MEETPETNKEENKQPNNFWMGMIFLFGGVVLILNQLNLLPFEVNWWALFIMLPAAGMLNGAYNRFRSHSNVLSMDVVFTALIGLILVILSVSMLLGADWNVNWSLFWPLIIILIGLGMIFGRSNKR